MHRVFEEKFTSQSCEREYMLKYFIGCSLNIFFSIQIF